MIKLVILKENIEFGISVKKKKKKYVGILVSYETSRKLLLNLKLHSLLGKKRKILKTPLPLPLT